MTPPDRQSPMTQRYAWYMLCVLTAINFVNYVDRQVIISLGPFIRRDLDLSYSGFGWLITAFMLIHSITSVPFGILSDRWLRRRIIAVGVFFWSAATFASGLAANFAHLIAARAAVGIGEAAYAPAANSMLSDAFPVQERSRILGLFNLGMFAGGALGLVLGGVLGGLHWDAIFADFLPALGALVQRLLGQIVGWRVCMLFVSLPGFILALLAWVLHDPPRVTPHRPTPVRALFYNSTLIYVFVGGIITAFTAGALIVWMPQYVTDIRHFPPQEAGLLIGAVGVTGGLLGVMVGSYLADWLYVRWPGGRMATIGAGLLLSSPFVMFSLYTTSRWALLTHFFVAIFFIVWYTGPIIAVIHDVVPPDLKATAQAMYIFLIHLFGDTFSPSMIGWLADRVGLQLALLPLAIINVIGGVVFLIGCRRLKRQDQQGWEEGQHVIHDLSRTGTLES